MTIKLINESTVDIGKITISGINDINSMKYKTPNNNKTLTKNINW